MASTSATAGPIQAKLTLSRALGAENDVCPPGVWTCSSGKRSEISKISSDTPEDTVKLSQTAEDACPPGVWTRSTGKRSEITQEEAIIAMTPIHKDEPERQDRENCSSENWVCKKKRMLKQLLKEELNKPTLPKALEDACPPGVWTCSTGKR